MRQNTLISVPAAMLITAMLLTLGGCGRRPAVSEPAENTGSVIVTEHAGSSGSDNGSGKQNGERFEDVIVIEGMAEPVRYEHIRNDTLGFEMDYDYELFERHSGPDHERFVSVYDSPDDTENYLEVMYSPQDAETIAASVSAVLSVEYDIGRDDSFMLERTGSCIRIDASAEKGGLKMPDRLQTVYIIPADDGCRIAAAHFSIESAEGFGRRFRAFMDTFSVIACLGEKRISDGQAVSAVRNYCSVIGPGTAAVADAGEYPAYWDISSSDDNGIVVIFRSYTGALNRYYIDPVSGETYVTEFVPGITDGEQRTGESVNLWDYVF